MLITLPRSRPGSSPLARGLPGTPRTAGTVRGIIPARAGFTPTCAALSAGATDHPRSRGVYPQLCQPSLLCLGSSPLARGLPVLRRVLDWRPGIIPARAGFTPSGSPTTGRARDHPRSRGVYAWPPVSQETRSGSSPLARGLPGFLLTHAQSNGIIPARAGFTRRRPGPAGPSPDHPRSRGVYTDHDAVGVADEGSSPLARGLPGGTGGQSANARIIPARAGFTPRIGSTRPERRDHPRSRGVYHCLFLSVCAHRGSSPLA